jgi:hypothetical protein
MSLIGDPISQPSLDISPIWTALITVKVQRRPVYILSEKIGVLMLLAYREFLSTVMTPILIFLLCHASYVWSFNISMNCLNSRRCFVLCLVCIPYLVLVQLSGDRD